MTRRGQAARGGRLDLAPILAQLGLDERQVEERVRLGLGGEGAQLGCRAADRFAILGEAQEALLREAPAAVAGQPAEADVVVLADP